MADREWIAATLTAALLQKIGAPREGQSPAGQAAADRVAIGRHAVTLYETILGMLPAAKE